MDDPLIGLTIYDTSTKSAVDEGLATMKALDEGLERSVENTTDECFPCLPSIPDDQERLKSSVESSRRVANATESIKENPEISQSCVEDEDSIEAEQGAVHLPKNFWLMRLFQSSLFDMYIAIGYLFNSKDLTVQSYLGSRLFVSALVLMF